MSRKEKKGELIYKDESNAIIGACFAFVEIRAAGSRADLS
jgi:hypothetical protein